MRTVQIESKPKRLLARSLSAGRALRLRLVADCSSINNERGFVVALSLSQSIFYFLVLSKRDGGQVTSCRTAALCIKRIGRVFSLPFSGLLPSSDG
eukprot:scaffold294_cov221-Amphora_coffeaeformis.AAC.16